MNHCKDCRYWGGTHHYLGHPMHEEDGAGLRQCRLTLVDWRGDQTGYYGPGGHCDPREREKKDTMVSVSAGDQGGSLWTPPEFGCVQWEPRPEVEEEPPRYVVLWGRYAENVRRFHTFEEALTEYRSHDDARSLFIGGHAPQHKNYEDADSGLSPEEEAEFKKWARQQK